MRYSQGNRRNSWRSSETTKSEQINLKESVSQAAGTIKDLAGSAFGQLYNVAKGINLSDKALKLTAVAVIASSLLTAETAHARLRAIDTTPSYSEEYTRIFPQQSQSPLYDLEYVEPASSKPLSKEEMLSSPLDPAVRQQYEEMRKFLVEYESAASKEYFDRLEAKVKSSVSNAISVIKERDNAVKETLRAWNKKAIDYTAAMVSHILRLDSNNLLLSFAQVQEELMRSDLAYHDNIVKMQKNMAALCSQYSKIMPLVQRKDSGHTAEEYSKFAEGMVASVATDLDLLLKMPQNVNFTNSLSKQLNNCTPEQRINLVDYYMQSFAQHVLPLIEEDRQLPVEKQSFSYIDLRQFKRLAKHGALADKIEIAESKNIFKETLDATQNTLKENYSYDFACER